MIARPRARRAPGHASPRAAPTPHFPDVARALDAVRRIVRALRVAEQRTRGETGLTAAQLFVLGRLADAPAVSLTALAARTMTDRTSVAAVVERLAAMGLVATDRDPADRRRVVARITDAGRRRLRAAPVAPTSLLVQGLEAMAAGERRALAGGLERLVAAMGIDDEPAGMLFDEAQGRGGRRGR